MNAIKPLVSISCLTYNHAKYIRKTLESFLSQKTGFPIEVLIHDDASTDGTAEIVKEYEEKYPDIIKPIYESENQWSKGIRGSDVFNFPRANTKYIAMCEGDDYWTDPLKLQKQVDFLEENPHYIICYHDAIIIDENGNYLKSSKLPDHYKRDFTTDELIKGAWILTLAMCFRNVLKQFPDELSRVYNGDIFLISLLGKYGKGKYMADIFPAAYRKHSTSVWSSVDEANQIIHNGDTRAWLCRYYKRIGQNHYANYFRTETINHFANALSKIAESGAGAYENIVQRIFTQYTDIMDRTVEKRLREILGATGYLIDTDVKDDRIKSPIDNKITHPQRRAANIKRDINKRRHPETYISVCIPTYNRAAMLSEALESVLKQNYKNYEIIIVDDGSTDNTAEVVQGFNSKKIRYIQKEHSGAPATRNRCVEESRGEFLLWLDSDDILMQTAMEEYHKAHLQYPDADILYCYFIECDPNGNRGIARMPDWYKNTRTLTGMLIFKPQFSNVGLFVHRRVYSKIGMYNPRFYRAHDYEFFARIAQYGKLTLKLVAKPLVLYRLHDHGHLSGTMSGKDLRYEWIIIDYLLDKNTLQKLFPEDHCDNPDVLAEKYYLLASRYLSVNHIENAIAYLQKSLLFLDHSDRSILLTSLIAKRNTLSEKLQSLRNIPEKTLSEQETCQMIERQLLPLSNIKIIDTGQADAYGNKASETEVVVSGLTSIIILISDQLDYAKKCIKSIRRNTRQAHEIIFVDNGSTGNTIKWLQNHVGENKNCRLISNKDNIGRAKGFNQGINLSRGEFILLLDNDVLVGDGWLDALLQCLNSRPEIGIVGPIANTASGLQQSIEPFYPSADHFFRYAADFKERFHRRRIPTKTVSSFCMLFRRQITEKIGLMDESFGTGQFEDEDYCLRTVLAGYKNVIAGDVLIHRLQHDNIYGHKISDRLKAYENRQIFDRKWKLSLQNKAGKKLAVTLAMEKADDLYFRGKTHQAVEVLINCIKIAPDEKEIYLGLARLFIETKKFSEAQQAIVSLPESAKDEIQALELAGFIKEGLGNDEEAAIVADKLIAIHSSYPPALNLQGILAYKKGDKEKARDYFSKAVDVDPGWGESYTNLGVLLWSQDDQEQGFSFIKRGFILSPTLPDASSLYYSAACSLVRLEELEGDFQSAARLYPNNRNLAFLYIDTLIQQEKFDAALLSIQDALVTFGLDEGTLHAALVIREKIGPLQINPEKKNTLSFCMIVKNEEKHLVKCLKSIRDVADEIIIVDTGSTDKTKDIATVFGAKVYNFPWTGDFSAARNESLKKAMGDWIFVLDADEAISALNYDDIKKLINKKTGRKTAYSIMTRNYVTNASLIGWSRNSGQYPEEQGAGWVPSAKVRLFPNGRGIRFEDAVHETLEASLKLENIALESCPVVIHHYGKLDEAGEQQKGENYYRIGKAKYQSEPDNMKYLLELARQAHVLGKNEEALDLWLKLITLLDQKRGTQAYEELARVLNSHPEAEAYLQLASVYLHLNLFQKALESSRKAMSYQSDQNEYFYLYALCEILAGSRQDALASLQQMLKKSPDYPPALFLLFVIYCLEGNRKDMEQALWILRQQGVRIASPANKIARQLYDNKRKDDALLILTSLQERNLHDEESLKILTELQNNQS